MQPFSTLTHTLRYLCLLLPFIPFSSVRAQNDVIFQAFYWNTHPGDVSDPVNGGIWWDTLSTVAPELAGAGITTVWAPPMTKGFGNLWDMGYGLYDYYDLGEYDQKGSTRTRHGTRAQLDNMIQTMHANGLQVMADVVLNHRGGGDAQANYEYNQGPFFGLTEWLLFYPSSGRFPGIPAHFTPNNSTPNQDPPYNNPLFFNDISYFNQNDQVPPPGGWYNGAPAYGLGSAADSLIAWGRWLMQDVGFDEMRLDAVKHIDPAFLAKFLVETRNDGQPYAVGEFFDFNGASLKSYQDNVEANGNSGTASPQFSIFDFELQGQLKGILNNTSGSSDLYWDLGDAGLVLGHGESGFDVATFIDNHDKDRIGFRGGDAPDGDGNCPAGQIKSGNSCLILDGDLAPDHDPVISDKEDMGYPYIMAAEGRPTVFWKDWFWFGMGDDLEWQIALRNSMATGGSYSSTLANEDGDGNNNPYWDPAFGGNCNGGNMMTFMRWGLSGGTQDGLVLGINDHNSDQLGMYVNTAFSNKFLKDYSDGFMFDQSQAFSDSRALIKANARDYSWWGLTGQYPHPPRVADPVFTLDAGLGGSVHFIVLDADEIASFTVNGSPIAAGDQIAIANSSDEICGVGRVGQEFGWDPNYDMLIEVLGPYPVDGDPTGGAANGMAVGEAFRVLVFDQSAGQIFEASSMTFANTGTSGTFNSQRPETPGRSASFTQPNTTSQATFAFNGISRLTSFTANNPATSFPVEWLGLEVVVEGQQAALNWTVAQEVNNQHFEVQMQPIDGTAFTTLDIIPGRGTDASRHTYRYQTSALEPGTYLFRIRQVDLDGSATLSPQVRAIVHDPGMQVEAFPNPTQGDATISIFTQMSAPIHLQLFNMAGQIVWKNYQQELNAGQHSWIVPLSQHTQGLYTLRINNGHQVQTVRLMRT